MTLTEQWKHGKLKEGWYYYKASDGRNDIATEYGLYCVEADNNVELEVLAPVPSYEKYKCLETGMILSDSLIKNTEKENQQLKELLKKCYKMLAQYQVENSEPSLDENIKLLTKIDNVIGEKK